MVNTKQSKTEGVDWEAIRTEGAMIRKGLARATADAAILEARIAAQNHHTAFFALASTALELEQLARKADATERAASKAIELDRRTA